MGLFLGDENLSTTGTLASGALSVTGTGAFSSTISAAGSTVGNLTLADGSITSSSGSISFGDENLVTTGTLASGALSVTGTGAFSSTINAAVVLAQEILLLLAEALQIAVVLSLLEMKISALQEHLLQVLSV